MKVERRQRLVLQHVHHVRPDPLPDGDLDRVVVVIPGDPVPRHYPVAADLCVAQTGEEEGDLDGRVPPLRGVDDHHPVQATRDVLRKRSGVAVIWVDPRRPGLDLVHGLRTGWDRLPAILFRAVCAVEVDVVRVAGAILEANPDQVALRGPDHRAWDRPVVGPSLDMCPSPHLEQTLLDRDLDLAGDTGSPAVRRRREGELIQGIGSQRGGWREDVAVEGRGTLVVEGGVANRPRVGVAIALGCLRPMPGAVPQDRPTEENRAAETGLSQQIAPGETVPHRLRRSRRLPDRDPGRPRRPASRRP